MLRKGEILGFSAEQVEQQRILHGTNELPAPKVETFWDKLWDNFNNALIRILCIACGITITLAILGYADWLEGVGIGVTVLIATLVSTYSEYKNENNFQTLQQQASAVHNVVFRDRAPVSIPVTEIVVGDLILLQAGDKVPADGPIVDGWVNVNQASLNGEPKLPRKSRAPNATASVPGTPSTLSAAALNAAAAASPTSTSPSPSPASSAPPAASSSPPPNLSVLDDPHRVFRGTIVVDGEAVMRAELIGTNSVYGRLAKSIAESEAREAPLKAKLADLADTVARIGYVAATLICLSFLGKQIVADNGYSFGGIVAYFRNWPVALHDVVTSAILAIIVLVVAVPEGLPMMIAMVLSLNMRKLLARSVLVRRLVGIETAGCMDLLFADKTGTLTKGVFQPQVFLSAQGAEYGTVAAVPPALRSVLSLVIRESSSAIATLREEPSARARAGAGPAGSGCELAIEGGNASDRALLHFLGPYAIRRTHASLGLGSASLALARAPMVVVEDELLFSSVNKFSGSQVRLSLQDVKEDLQISCQPGGSDFFSPSGGMASITLVKGAPEKILSACTRYYTGDGEQASLDVAVLDRLHRTMDRLSQQAGMRLIAVATARTPLLAPKHATSSSSSAAAAAESKAEGAHTHTHTDEEAARLSAEEEARVERERMASLPVSLSLVGIVGVADEIREESARAVRIAREAGVQVVMVTGDRLETAMAVARAVGLFDDVEASEEECPDCVITSDQLRLLSDEELRAALPRLRVVARALPSDKTRLVEAGQASIRLGYFGHNTSAPPPSSAEEIEAEATKHLLGAAASQQPAAAQHHQQQPAESAGGKGSRRIVGMTGDGVNDSAALKRADVSFAMGSGSEVAKEASDIVILDDNFASILQASLYGRTIFKSIRKFVVFQSTINCASMLIVFIGPFMGFDFPLTLIQLLWLNLIMDTLAALSFGGEPALDSYMRERPVHRDAPIINKTMWLSILCNGAFIASYAILFLTYDPIHQLFDRHAHQAPPIRYAGDEHEDPATAVIEHPAELEVQGGRVFLTAFFCFFIFICTFNAFNVRTHRLNLFHHLLGNLGFAIIIPSIFIVQVIFTAVGGRFLRTVPLTWGEWRMVTAMAFLIIPWDLTRKIFLHRLAAAAAPHRTAKPSLLAAWCPCTCRTRRTGRRNVDD